MNLDDGWTAAARTGDGALTWNTTEFPHGIAWPADQIHALGLAADLHPHAFAGPGHWNDLDLLVPGTPAAHPFDRSLTDEQRQLSLWAEEAGPLLISTDLTTLIPAEQTALKTPDIIAIDQSGSPPSTAVTSRQAERKRSSSSP